MAMGMFASCAPVGGILGRTSGNGRALESSKMLLSVSPSRKRRNVGGFMNFNSAMKISKGRPLSKWAFACRTSRSSLRRTAAGLISCSSSDMSADNIMAKYGGQAKTQPAVTGSSQSVPAGSNGDYVPKGTLLILLLNIGLFVLEHVLHMSWVKALHLYHSNPQWFQFITCTFCHANWSHLSNNIFFLYFFGEKVEVDEGCFGVWFTYLVTGVGASLASYLLTPSAGGGGSGLFGFLGGGGSNIVSLGASGAVFGLFAVSVLVKLSKGLKLWKLMEAFILGQFVVKQVLSEVKMQAAAGASLATLGGVDHVAHLAGAMMGVILIFALSKLPGSEA